MYASHIFKRIGTCSCSGSGGQYIILCCVQHKDDVLTTGATFIALRRRLIAHGAKFVIGMFLAKTIAFEDERKDLSINDYTNPTTSE